MQDLSRALQPIDQALVIMSEWEATGLLALPDCLPESGWARRSVDPVEYGPFLEIV